MAHTKKGKKLNLRLTEHEHRALMLMADREGISMTALIVNHIRHEAKKKGIPV